MLAIIINIHVGEYASKKYCDIQRREVHIDGALFRSLMEIETNTAHYLNSTLVVCFFLTILAVCTKLRKIGWIVVFLIAPVCVFRGIAIAYFVASNWESHVWSCKMTQYVLFTTLQSFIVMLSTVVFVFYDKMFTKQRTN